MTYGLTTDSPFGYHGAGRLGHNTYLVLRVTLFVRQELDPAGSDQDWSRDPDYGGLVMRQKIVDLLQDQFLFLVYDTTTFLPVSGPLLLEGIQQVEAPAPTKPDTDTTATEDGGDVGGFGEYNLYFQLKIAQKLTTG